MSKAINYLGIARKAGALETGEENSSLIIREGKAKLLIVAQDASDNAKKRAEGFVFQTGTPLSTVPYTKAEISGITGRNGCSMAVFTDIGLAGSFIASLEQEYGETYAALSADLAEKCKKAAQRRKEAEAHRRSRKAGNRRKSV